MSVGNVFTILINNTKEDTLLSATSKILDVISKTRERAKEDCLRTSADYYANLKNAKNDPDFFTKRKEYIINPIKFCSEKAENVTPTYTELCKSHNIYINSIYKPFVPIAFTYLKCTDAEGNATFGNEIKFKMQSLGVWISDMVIHLKLTGLKAINAGDKVKYADRLGHRILEEVSFKMNNVVLDKYGTEELNKYLEYDLPINKRNGWMRNIGQEQPSLGYVTPDPYNNEFREYRLIGDGPQTLKREHPVVDLWIPLIFWFNTDVRLAFPNIATNHGDAAMTFKLRKLSDLVASVGYVGDGSYTKPTIELAELYINHINTIPEVANIVVNNYNFNLIRVHKKFEKIIQDPANDVSLKELNFPIESMFAAFRPMENYDSVDNWHKNMKLTEVLIKTPVIIDNPTPNTFAANQIIYYKEDVVVNKIGLKLNDIDIYPLNSVKLNSSYIPVAFPGVNTPLDFGWMMFNFQLRPDVYDPSGHINLTKTREVYMRYDSSYISPTNRVNMIVLAKAINFLIVEPGNVRMRLT